MLLDLGTAYNTTYDNSPFVRIAVDYAADPPAFDRYTEADRATITARLEAICAAHIPTE